VLQRCYAVTSQDAEAGSSPAQWRVVWLERENGGAGLSGNWAGFSKDQVQPPSRIPTACDTFSNATRCGQWGAVAYATHLYSWNDELPTRDPTLLVGQRWPLCCCCCVLQLLKCGDVVLWEVLGPNRFRVHLFRAGLHESDPALRDTLPGGARCGPFYSGESARLFAPLLLRPMVLRHQFGAGLLWLTNGCDTHSALILQPFPSGSG
jgi:hypothetical protein